MQVNYGRDDVTIKVGLVENTGDELKNQAKKKGEQAGKKYQQSFRNASKGLSFVGQGSSGLGKLSKLFSGMSAKMAGTLAVAGLAVKAVFEEVSSVLDRMFLTASENFNRLQGDLQRAQQRTAKNETKKGEYGSIFEQLEGLANKNQPLTGAEVEEAEKLIKLLTERYGDLGITVDKTMGKVNGLDDAFRKMHQLNAKQSIFDLQKELRLVQQMSKIATEKALISTEAPEWITATVGKFLSKYASELGIEYTGGDLTKAIKGLTPEKQLRALEFVRSQAQTDYEVKDLDKAIELLRTQLDIEEQLNNLRTMGYKSEAEYARGIAELRKRDPKFRASMTIVEESKKQEEIQKRIAALREGRASKINALGVLESDLQTTETAIQNVKKEIEDLEKRKERAATFGKDKFGLTAVEISALIATKETEILGLQEKQLRTQFQIEDVRKRINKEVMRGGVALLDNIRANDKNYRIQKRIREIEESTGSKLKPDQIDALKQIDTAEQAYKRLQDYRSGFDFSIKTNELTARGGFAGGAVVPNVSAAEKTMLSYQSTIAQMVTRIQNMMQNGDKTP